MKQPMPSESPHRPVSPLTASIAAALILGVLGTVVGKVLDWSTSAYFGFAVLAALAAFSLYARHLVAEAPPLAHDADLRWLYAPHHGKAGQAPELVVALIGHSRSGKTEIAKWMADEYPGLAWASCGAFVKEEARHRGLDLEKETTDRLGLHLVEEFGAEGFTERVLKNSRVEDGARLILIDDVYHESVFRAVQQRWGHLYPVEVQNPIAGRSALGRVLGRAADESPSLDREADKLLKDVPPKMTIRGASAKRGAVRRGKELMRKLEPQLPHASSAV